jgi:hypothetical protein
MAVVVGLPRVHRRIGRRTMAFVAIAATVAAIAGTKVRYDEPVIGWRTLVSLATRRDAACRGAWR